SFYSNIELSYPSLAQFIENQDNANLKLIVEPSKLNTRDALFFSPDLSKNPQFKQVSSSPILLKGEVKGKMAALNISGLQMKWGQGTEFNLNGKINGLPNTENLSFELPDIRLVSINQDLA